VIKHRECIAINFTTDNENFNLLAPRIITVSAGSDLNMIVIDSVGITFRKPPYMAYFFIWALLWQPLTL